jgi:hypothetical protein
MRKLKLFLFAITALFLFTTFQTKAQDFTVSANPFQDRTFLVTVPSTLLDSTDVIYSNWFTLAGWDYRENYVTHADTAGNRSDTYIWGAWYLPKKRNF